MDEVVSPFCCYALHCDEDCKGPHTLHALKLKDTTNFLMIVDIQTPPPPKKKGWRPHVCDQNLCAVSLPGWRHWHHQFPKFIPYKSEHLEQQQQQQQPSYYLFTAQELSSV